MRILVIIILINEILENKLKIKKFDKVIRNHLFVYLILESSNELVANTVKHL